MKTFNYFLVMASLAASLLTVRAASLVSQYWPMYDGDVRYFSGVGGASYLEFIEDEFEEPAQFTMYLYRQEPPDEEYSRSGRSTYGYSGTGDRLLNYGQKGPIGAYLYFDPPWSLLTDSLLTKGGTRSSRFYAGVPEVTNVAVLAVAKVKSAGTVTVPAGTFHDCRSVFFTIKVAGRSGVVGGQAMVLAPGVGPIKMGLANIRGQFIGWQSLTGGTVGGVDVRELVTRIPPMIVVQPRSKMLSEGRPLRLFVRGKGPALTYQWYFNHAPVPGANLSAYTAPSIQLAQAGNYFAVVSNSGGSVTSVVARVTVKPR